MKRRNSQEFSFMLRAKKEKVMKKKISMTKRRNSKFLNVHVSLTSSHLTDRVDLKEESDRSYIWSTKVCSHLLLTHREIYIVRMSTRRISTRKDAVVALVFPVECTKYEILLNGGMLSWLILPCYRYIV